MAYLDDVPDFDLDLHLDETAARDNAISQYPEVPMDTLNIRLRLGAEHLGEELAVQHAP